MFKYVLQYLYSMSYLSMFIGGTRSLPFAVMIVGLFLVIIYLLYVYKGMEKESESSTFKKKVKREPEVNISEYECPRCRAWVDSISSRCPQCSAEFENDKFSCPICGEEVSHEDDICPGCNKEFISEKKDYECPLCRAPVESYSTECSECNSTFWSPVRRYTKDIDKIEKKNKKLDPSLIEIVGEDQD